MAERVRVTVAMDPAVLATFRTMAEMGGMSVSRCIGEWLADTADGAQLVAKKMVEARSEPARVMRELQASARGLVDMVDGQADQLRRERGGIRPRGAAPQATAKRAAPSSNTGLKSPRTGKRRP